ncbi:MAG: malate dehydrogenase (quinone) [Verrucomicrobia bacterium]|nr:MAG: malate dehydrogenase (quinone) [Verrucomicrobiota bacterium]
MSISHLFHRHHTPSSHPDVVLIGAGIMSATLGVLLKELHPALKIEIYERLEVIAGESSDAWNNAGTGHSAFCELNYTPQGEDGSIDTRKALKIAESFEVSKQFWAYLVEKQYLQEPKTFINSTPHMSIVWDKNVAYLKQRFELLTQSPLFNGMTYCEDKEQLRQWIPLIMEGRDPDQDVAVTRMELGTDINFGALTRALFGHLQTLPDVRLHLGHEVTFIERRKADQHWELEVLDLKSREKRTIETKFLFIGAGGGSLPLLEETEIPEADGYGGFPVSGQWLVCKNEEVINRHAAKVYGKAEVGAPPMSVPHLDTRIIEGKKALLFGPYAGFSTKFLKHGAYTDLPHSLQVDNILPMLSAGIHNLPLTKYLIDQVRQSPEDRLAALQKFVPTAKLEDWNLEEAGQRVQIIKKDRDQGGKLEFGTEIVNSADGSVAALLGASPGASTSVSIMLDLLQRCFKEQINTPDWQAKLKSMIPSYGRSLGEDAALCREIREQTSRTLNLKPATIENP